jgi:hypothetical protein
MVSRGRALSFRWIPRNLSPCLLSPRAITPGLSHNGGHCASRTRRGCRQQANVAHHIEKVSAKDGHNRVDTLTELSATMVAEGAQVISGNYWQERGLAAHPCAGAVQRWRCFSRCTDRSAGGCADRCTLATVRARATARWPPHSARGWQRRQGPPGVVASADHGGHHCAGAGIRRSGCPQRLGKTVRPCRRTDGVIRA